MDNLIALAYLHWIGFTHKDLKKIFESQNNYFDFLSKIQNTRILDQDWINTERKEKILKRLESASYEQLTRIIKEKNISIITIDMSEYPEKLRTITQSPYLIYTRGHLGKNPISLWIVGSRKSTSYGSKILERIIPELIAHNCSIISGWAHGIDTLGHQLTIENNGHTVSVFWSWIDIFYPKQNSQLFEKIIEKWGALVSIFPIGTKPEPYYFPIRNEIVAALSDGIIIPEAWEKSGTLITAQLALEHGRDVFAVPGDIFRETSMWTNALIAKWEAKCILGARDILEEYIANMGVKVVENQEISWESETQKNIYNEINNWNNTPDSISEKTQIPVHEIMIEVSMMEINGLIKLNNNGKYETQN